MNETTFPDQEGNGRQLIEYIIQLTGIALGEGAVVCQVWLSAARTVGDASRDGDAECTETAEYRDGATPLLAAVCEGTRADGGEW